jgi:hypothetical protein
LTRVDPWELTLQTTAIAWRIEPRAILLTVSFKGALSDGAVDLRGDAVIAYGYEFAYTDPTRALGYDKIDGAIHVTAHPHGFRAICMRDSIWLRGGEQGLPEPRCPLKEAWGLVVASGVPEDSIVSVMYGFLGPPFHWSFLVDGSPGYHRELDGATCRWADPADRMRAWKEREVNHPKPAPRRLFPKHPGEVWL